MLDKFNSIKFDIIKPQKKDIKMLKNLKLKTILTDTSSNISTLEKNKIIQYVNKYINENYKKYNLIVSKENILGAYCIDQYKDGLLLDEIYIFQKYRNKGIATKIITDLQNTINKNIYLWVYKSNKIALKLYTHLEFNIETETETRYLMKWQNK